MASSTTRRITALRVKPATRRLSSHATCSGVNCTANGWDRVTVASGYLQTLADSVMVGKPTNLCAMSTRDLLDAFEKNQNSLPFNQQLKHVPEEWRQPIVDVVDTFSTVKLGLDGLGIKDTFALVEAVKFVVDRHDKSVAADS